MIRVGQEYRGSGTGPLASRLTKFIVMRMSVSMIMITSLVMKTLSSLPVWMR